MRTPPFRSLVELRKSHRNSIIRRQACKLASMPAVMRGSASECAFDVYRLLRVRFIATLHETTLLSLITARQPSVGSPSRTSPNIENLFRAGARRPLAKNWIGMRHPSLLI
jgi:hypothetical protein